MLTLPAMARAIIEAQPRHAQNDHVFPASRGSGPARNWSWAKIALDAKLNGMRAWTVHDLRRTARSLLSRAGVSVDTAERVLGHALPGVRGIYDRHGYAAEKQAALERLARLIDSIIHSRGNSREDWERIDTNGIEREYIAV